MCHNGGIGYTITLAISNARVAADIGTTDSDNAPPKESSAIPAVVPPSAIFTTSTAAFSTCSTDEAVVTYQFLRADAGISDGGISVLSEGNSSNASEGAGIDSTRKDDTPPLETLAIPAVVPTSAIEDADTGTTDSEDAPPSDTLAIPAVCPSLASTSWRWFVLIRGKLYAEESAIRAAAADISLVAAIAKDDHHRMQQMQAASSKLARRKHRKK